MKPIVKPIPKKPKPKTKEKEKSLTELKMNSVKTPIWIWNKRFNSKRRKMFLDITLIVFFSEITKSSVYQIV